MLYTYHGIVSPQSRGHCTSEYAQNCCWWSLKSSPVTIHLHFSHWRFCFGQAFKCDTSLSLWVTCRQPGFVQSTMNFGQVFWWSLASWYEPFHWQSGFKQRISRFPVQAFKVMLMLSSALSKSFLHFGQGPVFIPVEECLRTPSRHSLQKECPQVNVTGWRRISWLEKGKCFILAQQR